MRSDQNSNDEDEGLSAFDNLDPVSTVSEVSFVPEVRPSLRSPSMPAAQSLGGSAPSMPPVQSLGGSAPSLPPPVPAATLPSMPPPPAYLPPVPPAAALPSVGMQEQYGFDDEEESTQFYERGNSAPPAPGAAASAEWSDGASETYGSEALPGFSSGEPSPFDDLPPVAGGYPSPFPPAPSSMSAPLAPQAATEEWPAAERVGRRRITVAIVLVAVAAVALAAVWKFGASKPAVAMLSTEPPDVQVTVDGMQLASSHSPFILELTADERHEVVVSKDGFEQQTLPISLESGERLTLPLVKLASTKIEAGFALDSQPSGARVFIDGADSGKTTPVRMTDVAEGMHTIRLEAGDKAAMDMQVFVVAGKVLELPTAALASKAAHVAAAPQPTRSQAQVTAPEPEPRAASKSARGSKAKRSRLASVARPAAPAASSGTGVLRLNSLPWSQVTVDGKPVGNTPLMNLPLPAGAHTIRMVNPDMGLTKTIKVTVKAGDTVTKVVNMAQ